MSAIFHPLGIHVLVDVEFGDSASNLLRSDLEAQLTVQLRPKRTTEAVLGMFKLESAKDGRASLRIHYSFTQDAVRDGFQPDVVSLRPYGLESGVDQVLPEFWVNTCDDDTDNWSVRSLSAIQVSVAAIP